MTGPGPLEGIYTTRYIPTVDVADNPWIELFQQVWDEHGADQELSNFMVYGMSGAYAMVQALQAAGQNPTRQDLVDAVEAQGSEWEGPWLAPMEYSEESHRGITGVAVAQIQGGGYETLTPVYTTGSGDSEIEEYTEETSTPPENGIPDQEPAN